MDVKLCTECVGEGTCNHECQCDPDRPCGCSEPDKCKSCKGSGRIVKLEHTVRFKYAYKGDDNELAEFDEKIKEEIAAIQAKLYDFYENRNEE